LFVRFTGPAGVHVTLYPGPAAGRTFPTPVTVGFRPGYIYRIKVSGFPGHPEAIVFPTLEVRGTLQLPPKVRAADYPAPVDLTDADVSAIGGGAVLTRVVVLENPERATPLDASVDQPLESLVPAGRDPLEEARERGRPVLVTRLGQRDFTPEEMAHQAIPGTILLPGDKGLGPPAALPWVPWSCVPLYDPLYGPLCPEEECLHDGGDHGRPAGIDAEGRLRGLDPADTVAEYTDSSGRRKLAVSCCICICVPRYIILRSDTVLAGFSILQGPGDTTWVQGQLSLGTRVPSVWTRQAERPAGIRGLERPSGATNVQSLVHLLGLEVLNAVQIDIGPAELLGTQSVSKLTEVQRLALKRQVELALALSKPYGLQGVEQVLRGPAVVGRVRGVNVISTLQEVRDVTVCCEEPPCPPPPDKPLKLLKWADRQAAHVGDVVTIFLKYTNLGCQPITDVAVSDSLTGRLQYIPGSAKADRDAVFTLEENEAGSVILRWEIGGRLLPGSSGVVSFKARIR
jgi:uncharacterized repeat protein (TIGR01451 family)